MRILFRCCEFPPVGGGGGRALRHLCRHLTELDVEVDVLTSRGEERGTIDHGEARV